MPLSTRMHGIAGEHKGITCATSHTFLPPFGGAGMSPGPCRRRCTYKRLLELNRTHHEPRPTHIHLDTTR
jgi:hypothetical protein